MRTEGYLNEQERLDHMNDIRIKNEAFNTYKRGRKISIVILSAICLSLAIGIINTLSNIL